MTHGKTEAGAIGPAVSHTPGSLCFSLLTLRFKSAEIQCEFDSHFHGTRTVANRLLAGMAIFMATVEFLDAMLSLQRFAWIELISACILFSAGVLAISLDLRLDRTMGILVFGLVVVAPSVVEMLLLHVDTTITRFGLGFMVDSGLVFFGCSTLHPSAVVVAVLIAIPPASAAWWSCKSGVINGWGVVHAQLLGYFVFMGLAIWLQMRRNCHAFVLVCKLKRLKEEQV